jgi:hypothetical protein
MAIALAAAHHQATFNGLYYATIATVIPVLFVAVAVQGPAYANLLQQAHRVNQVGKSAKDELGGSLPDEVSAPLLRALRTIVEAITLTAYLLIAAGILGEITAIIALYRERASGTFGLITLTATIMLLLAGAFGPFCALVKAMWDTSGWSDLADRTAPQAEDTAGGNGR